MENYDFTEFPEQEFETRCNKARNLMADKSIDLLFISDSANFRYFTGCQSFTKNRPAYFFLPLEGDPFILSPTFTASSLRNMSWVKNVMEYKVPITANKIIDTLNNTGFKKARIGTEQNDSLFGGFRMNIQFEEFINLKAKMSTCQFLDVSDLMWDLRIKKSQLEIEFLRKACEITANAYEYMFDLVRSGMTELDASRLMVEGMMIAGADYPSQGKTGPCAFIITDASRPLGQPHMPVNKVIKKGDILHIDAGAIYHGYHADFARLGVVGDPNDEQLKLWEESVSGIQRSLEKVKPGNRLGDIEVHWHGIGIDGVEYPFVECDKEKTMDVGMVLGIENMVYSEIGESFHLEENVVVTDSGYDLLSAIPMDLFKIQ